MLIIRKEKNRFLLAVIVLPAPTRIYSKSKRLAYTVQGLHGSVIFHLVSICQNRVKFLYVLLAACNEFTVLQMPLLSDTPTQCPNSWGMCRRLHEASSVHHYGQLLDILSYTSDAASTSGVEDQVYRYIFSSCQ